MRARVDLRGVRARGSVVTVVVTVVDVEAPAVVIVVSDSFFFLSYAKGLPL